MSACSQLALVILLGLPVFSVHAQTEKEVEYDHYKECKNRPKLEDGCTIMESVRLEPGGTLRLTVKNTWSDLFEVRVRGYTPRPPRTEGQPMGAAVDWAKFAGDPAEVTAEEVVHASKYGGYIFTISPKVAPLPEDGEPYPSKDAKPLKIPGPAVVIVQIDQPEQFYAFSGGMSFTSLKDPAFVARATEGGASYTIAEDEDRDDEATVGFATFINFRPWKKHDWFWPGVGIGLETEGKTQYYASFGIRVADGIFFNPGLTLGQVSILPAGLEVGDNITDPNRLAEMDTHKEIGFFLGLSFKFLGGGKEAFERPFLGAAEDQ